MSKKQSQIGVAVFNELRKRWAVDGESFFPNKAIKPNVNLGGDVEGGKYEWEQDAETVTLKLDLPNATVKQIKVSFLNSQEGNVLRVEKQNKNLLDEELSRKIEKERSTWQLDGDQLVVLLEKRYPAFWSKVFKDEEIEIDLREIKETRIDDVDDVLDRNVRSDECFFATYTPLKTVIGKLHARWEFEY